MILYIILSNIIYYDGDVNFKNLIAIIVMIVTFSNLQNKKFIYFRDIIFKELNLN